MWQSGLLKVVLSSDYNSIIFLGSDRFLATWIAAILARITGKNVLFWSHGWTKTPRGITGLIRRVFYNLANDLLLYGHWAKCVAIQQGFKPEHVHVIGNSLNVSEQKLAMLSISDSRPVQVRKELFGDEKTPVVSCTSRLIINRRLDLLFKAVAALELRGHKINIALVGDGPERKTLEDLAKSLNIHVAFIGACYDEKKIGEILLASCVVVAPGMIGLSAMHALAFGVPVITHGNAERQMPEFEAVIPGVTGDLFEDGNLNSLIETLLPWIKSPNVDLKIQLSCKTIIHRFWSPEFQFQTIVRAVDGYEADDLYWIRQNK
jgi:glycosyltransferase involved in cell wall biosynthesis